ncbi:amino acid adenylation domain-containing protein [Pseudoalteromonas piscicida]|uniref:amino acid adenylation domain-containing protein n=1 Tax=Pseudoalteromonas piscicida TaxID=43662 RepID=UPI0030B4688D
MTFDDLLHELVARNIVIQATDKLKVSAPVGALDEQLKQALRQYKAQLIAEFSEDKKAAGIPKTGNTKAAMSAEQQGIFNAYQLEPKSDMFHMPAIMQFQGNINLSVLREAITELGVQHPAIASRYFKKSGEYWQQLSKRYIVVAHILAPNSDNYREAFFSQQFKLEDGDVFKALLVRHDNNRCELLLNVHHIAADGWSVEVLKQTLIDNYRKRVNRTGNDQTVKPSVSYIDYLSWQEKHQNAEKYAFWQNYLQGASVGPRLSLSIPPLKSQLSQNHIELALDEQHIHCVSEIAKKCSATTYHVWLALFSLIIARLQDHDDVFLVSPQMRREHPHSANIVGLLLENYLFRNQVSWQSSFSTLVCQIRDQHFKMQDVGALGLNEYATMCEPHAQSDGHEQRNQALLRYSVNMLNYKRSELKLEDADVSVEVMPPAVSKYDLTIYIRPDTDDYTVQYHFDPDFFDVAAVKTIHQKVLNVLLEVFNHPNYENHQLFKAEDNNPGLLQQARVSSDNLLGLIAKQCELRPQATAIEWQSHTLTYEALGSRVKARAQQLMSMGVGPGCTVAILARRLVDLPVAILATWACGASYVSVDIDLPEHRLRQLLKLCSPDAVVCFTERDRKRWSQLGITQAQLLMLDSELLEFKDEIEVDLHHQARLLNIQKAACITFTSGSTGEPKAVIGKHSALVSHLEHQVKRLKWTESDRFSFLSGLQNDPSQRDMFNPLCIGATLCIPSEPDISPERLREWLIENAITVMHLTPALSRYISSSVSGASEHRALSLRWIMISGDVLYWQDVKRLNVAAPNSGILNLFGTTESQRASTEYVCLEENEAKDIPEMGVVPVSTSGPQVQAVVINEQGLIASDLELGEIYLVSDQLSLGYMQAHHIEPLRGLGNSILDQHRSYATGDVGRKLNSGVISVLGRHDSQANVNGFRVSLLELECIALRYDGVHGAKAWVHKHEGIDQLWLHCHSTYENFDIKLLEGYLASWLPAYAVPHRLVVGSNVPMTSARKVDTRAIMAQSNPQPMGGEDSFSDEQKVIAEIWKSCLNIDNIHPADDFFQLGGNSLLALHLNEKLQTLFEVQYPVSQLIHSPTLADCLAFYQPYLLKDQRSNQVEPTSRLGWNCDVYKEGEAFSLTPVQESYWMGREANISLGKVATSAYVELQFTSSTQKLDMNRVNWVVNTLIRRHPMLRMQLTPDGKQLVLPSVPEYKLAHQNISSSEHPAFLQWRESMRSADFDVLSWPLFDIRCSQFDAHTAVLHLKVDLLLLDYWSGQVILREFAQLYFEPEEQLPELSAQFGDYIDYLNRKKDSEQYIASKQYWLDRLDKLPEAPSLPMKSHDEDSHSGMFIRREHIVAKHRWQNVVAKANSLGVTPSCMLMALFTAVLGRWTQQSAMTINLTLFDRPAIHPQINDVVGDFTSLLPLAVELGKNSLEHHARSIQQQLFEDLENRHFSGVEVIRERIKTAGISGAIFPVVFTNHLGMAKSLASDQAALHEQVLVQTYRESKSSQVWLDHVVGDAEGGVSLVWNTLDALFPDNMMAELFDCYTQYVDHMVDNLAAWGNKIEVALPEKSTAIISRANDTVVEYECKQIHYGFLKHAQVSPERPAILTRDRVFTYGELYNRASAIAHQLQQENVGRGELVAVSYHKGPEQIAACLAVLMVGGAYLPLDPQWPIARLQAIKDQAVFRTLLTDIPKLQNVTSELGVNLIVTTNLECSLPLAIENWLNNSDSTDLAYVIFTSGSTGTPKGVAMTHDAVDNTLKSVHQIFSVTADDTVFALSALHFDLSVYDIFGVFSAGAKIFLPDNEVLETPSMWAELVSQHDISIWNSVPALMQLALTPKANFKANSLRLVMLSGDWIPLTLPKDIRANYQNAQVVSLGGATEAAVWSIYFPINDLNPEWRSIPYGKALPNQQVWVLDRNLGICPLWVSGDIYIGGQGLAREYYGDLARSEQSFILHPESGERLYKTGDMGRYLADGNIEFLGRMDQQVKVNGYRIELGDIESALSSLDNVHSVVALADKQLTAVIVPVVDPVDANQSIAQWLSGLRTQLPAYMVPQRLLIMPKIPLTSNGKVDRKSLMEMVKLHSDNEADTLDVPFTDTALLILPYWQAVLPDAHINSGSSNFFQLGGSSLQAMRLLSTVNQEFDISLPVSELFTATTVNEFAECVRLKLIEKSARMVANQSLDNMLQTEMESGEL